MPGLCRKYESAQESGSTKDASARRQGPSGEREATKKGKRQGIDAGASAARVCDALREICEARGAGGGREGG